ncbi:MAG: endonuclease, partial [Planctomycetota bacterium]
MTYQLTLATLTLAVSASIATAKVWINELHYDNSGADANEFVEIVVAPDMAGIDLSTVDVHLYNGATGARYDTINFAAPTSQSSQNGFGVYSVSFAPLQNGAPDGLALAINGTLVAGQFLSYEGVFAGVGGPADGLLSIDLGVAETSSTASDESIQLTGVGDEYPDFLWTDPA